MGIQSPVGRVALVTLLGLNEQPELQATIAGWLDDKLLEIWATAGVLDWLPKSVLSLLFLQAGAYFVGRWSEGMARSARVGAADKPLSAVAQRWIGIAHLSYEVQLFLIIALLMGIFTALAPNAILNAEGFWRFLFGITSGG